MPMMCLPLCLGTNSQTLIISNWSNSSYIARIYCSSFMASLILKGLISETKAMVKQTSIRLSLVDTPFLIYPIMLSIGWFR